MKQGFFISVILIFLISCKKKDRIPSGILQQTKMQAVMWDMMRADQFLAGFVLNKDSGIDKTKESFRYYQQIFSIHKITESEFQNSFSYYREHPALLKAIMDSLSQGRTEAPTQMVDPPAKDSAITAPYQQKQTDSGNFRKKRPLPVN